MSCTGGILKNCARVVVIDDSMTMRKWLITILNSDQRLSVVGEASDAIEAREVIKKTSPDVITLDIEMPRMNGLEFLNRLMRLRPMPVVMISSETRKGSAAAVHALSLGAVSYLWKPDNPRNLDTAAVCETVFVAANAKVQEKNGAVKQQKDIHKVVGRDDQVILVGASTGGVSAIETFLSGLPITAPPVVIAQHMPSQFLRSFSSRLNGIMPHDIAMAQDGEILKRGQVRLAQSCDKQTGAKQTSMGWQIVMEPPEGYEKYNPSVEHLFQSAVQYAPNVVAIIMTGLGNDGARTMRILRDKGALTLGQSETSCVVYGMPRAAMEIGAVQEQVHIEKIASRLVALTESHQEASQ
ncbi:MAG: chemotaxis-specific protein-glutamate methyltransferase CheB [Paracoccaceae bacterium]